MNSEDAEEEKKQSQEGSIELQHDDPSDQTNDEVQLYRVHTKYDIVETEIKLLYYGKYLHLMVRPFKKDSTKVIMWEAGSKERRQEIVLENKNYQGSLQQEPTSFTYNKRQINFELGFKGDFYGKGHYTLKVEDLPIEYLDEAPKRERPSFEIARSEIKANMTG